MSKRKNVIRVGDKVKIVTPRAVARVGYPKRVSDYAEEAQIKYKDLLDTIGHYKAQGKVLDALSYALAVGDHFGGRERTIHFYRLSTCFSPEQEYEVISIRYVKTGIYHPPWSGYSYFGEYDYEPGYLEDCKTHKLLILDYNFEVLADDVVKVEKENEVSKLSERS